jgi:hypothetical protein
MYDIKTDLEKKYQTIIIIDDKGNNFSFVGPAAWLPGSKINISELKVLDPIDMPDGAEWQQLGQTSSPN